MGFRAVWVFVGFECSGVFEFHITSAFALFGGVFRVFVWLEVFDVWKFVVLGAGSCVLVVGLGLHGFVVRSCAACSQRLSAGT